ncbi:MAG: polyprenyl synthetase family protein [Pseudomonadota bacterium]
MGTDQTSANLTQRVASAYARSETRLEELAPSAERAPRRLHDAMRHSLLTAGKRVRPILTVLTAEACGAESGPALTPGCAIEMIHAASLILDDLPAMDDASLRRGRPTSHAMFGVDTAMLAAIGLMNHAFDVVAAADDLSDGQKTKITAALAASIGSEGLVAGQEEDLHGLDETLPREKALEVMHRRKTGALFSAACRIGAIVADAPYAHAEALHEFGMRLGHAFQTLDDVLDASATLETAGKDVGNDVGKPTLVAFHGLEAARAAAFAQRDAAISMLPSTCHATLSAYADLLVTTLMKRHEANAEGA